MILFYSINSGMRSMRPFIISKCFLDFLELFSFFLRLPFSTQSFSFFFQLSFISFPTIIFIKRNIFATHTKGWLTYQFSFSVYRWKNNKNKTQVGRRKNGREGEGVGWKTGKWWWKYRKKWNKFLLYNTFDRLYVVRIFML